LLVGATSWLALRFAVNTTSRGLEGEVTASLRAYETLWRARENMLASVSSLMSNMPEVRASFRTGDQATIRDTASEVWAKVSQEEAIFLVADPAGAVIASLGGGPAPPLAEVIRAASPRFPQQSKGFLTHAGRLWQIVVTPVYVDAQQGSALLNILLTGYPVNENLAKSLRQNTGSDFVFSTAGQPIASTLDPVKTAQLNQTPNPGLDPVLVRTQGAGFGLLAAPLLDIAGKSIGELRIVRSFDAAQERLDELQRGMLGLWTVAVLLGLGLSYALTRKIVDPIERLDKAAAEVARQNYDTRLVIDRGDELGRLAQSFNTMCVSLQQARGELIRQERLATIGQFATSIVHDLRNPLAAIYGGSEMLVDTGLNESQSRRIARNIYQASLSIQSLLQDLSNISSGKLSPLEPCSLAEVICASAERLVSSIDSQAISIHIDVDLTSMILVERARMERVFFNLIANAVEAMSGSGSIRIRSEETATTVILRITDNGPGIAAELKSQLFEPFATAGKRNGMGLGLALSRQTVRSHGGDLWSEPVTQGASFCVRLPLAGAATKAPEFHNTFTSQV
jgi:signal transduction histidine kinase